VQRALIKDIHRVFTYQEHDVDGQMFGLVSSDITNIKPNYESMIKGGQLKVTDMGVAQGIIIEL
jgi:Set1/Ash2 histone methyltransferase complex subunit ASH2